MILGGRVTPWKQRTGHETKRLTVAGCGVRPHHLGTRILRQSAETCRAGTAKRQVFPDPWGNET